ncbi:MAG: pyrrolo-quinoline quinone [Bryobacteraceae bacterium]
MRLLRMPLVAAILHACLFGHASVLTYHNDNGRAGQNLKETMLTPSNVNSSSFGKLFVIQTDGKVDAQPLYVPKLSIPGHGAHNVVFVATEHDSVYAVDADTGAGLWHVSLLKKGETPSDRRNCGQVDPEIGVTSTPIIDPGIGPHGTIYLIAMSKNSRQYHQRLHALDLTTGTEEFGGPTDVSATFPGTGDESRNGKLVFEPEQYEERIAPVLVNGVIYTAWASHCDIRPYTGWIMGYDAHTLKQTSVLDVTPNGNEGAFWSAGGGIAADAPGSLYLLAGNGSFDTALNGKGFPSNGNFGNAFLKIRTSNRALSVADYFNMFNTIQESNDDADLGSGGPLLLPDLRDASGHVRHLAVGAGKDKDIYIVDRDNLGKFNPNNNDKAYQVLTGAEPHGIFSSPAYFNNTLYYGGVNDVVRAFRISNARVSVTPASVSADKYPYPGTTPSISANGRKNGIVWTVKNEKTAVLAAYDASDLSRRLYDSNQAPRGRDHFGTGNKFITPMIANGKVYVGTTTGVGVFGLRH